MTIIWTIIVGAIIGALARFILPGRQGISILVTIILGILGGLIGSWFTQTVFNYSNANGGFAFIPFIVGVIVAALLIVVYGMVTGKKQV